jgi:Macrocin-O-methyltransferase (TylF)
MAKARAKQSGRKDKPKAAISTGPSGLARAALAISPKLEEPWVELPNGRTLADWNHGDEVAYNQADRQTEKALMFRRTFDFIKDNRISGDYHEFGCHRCRTFRMALSEARLHNMSGMEFWAFDSFEGLPATTSSTSVELWKRGALTTSEAEFMRMVREHGIYEDRVHTIKGFYADSLTNALRQRFMDERGKIAFVNVDCDLYESAVPVFEFLDPLMQEGTVIYIDDLFVGHRGSPWRGVARAFLEYQGRTRWRFLRHLDVGWWGRTYIVYLDKEAPGGVL